MDTHIIETMSNWMAMNTCEKKHSVIFIFGRSGDRRNTRGAAVSHTPYCQGFFFYDFERISHTVEN